MDITTGEGLWKRFTQEELVHVLSLTATLTEEQAILERLRKNVGECKQCDAMILKLED